MKLYRVISDAEFDTLVATGRFGAGPNSYADVKWFAESLDNALEWGEHFERWDGVPHRRVVAVELSDAQLAAAYRVGRLDGIGPAVCVDIAVLNSLPFEVVR